MIALIDRQQRQQLIDDLQRQFRVTLNCYERLDSGLRDDVTVHGCFVPPYEPAITDEQRRQVRLWLADRGWQFSRQYASILPGGEPVEYVFLAPEQRVQLSVGYHATRRACLAAILKDGLLAGEPARRTTDRSDTDGNVYVCEQLGTPADAGVQGSKTAHWWRAHLAAKNRYNDPDWVIVRVGVGMVPGVRACRDFWSESGVVLDGVERIPAEAIRLEYPAS